MGNLVQPQLIVPTEIRIPKVFIDRGKVEDALLIYQQHSSCWNPIGVHKEDFTIVGKYLTFWDTIYYWNIMLENSVRGYSLFLHEVTELDWYFTNYPHQRLDPFVELDHLGGFDEAHSLALVEEHRFLQRVAECMGHSFSLRELIISNPHADDPDYDWRLVEKQRTQDLQEDDYKIDQEKLSLVKQWYRDIGFRGGN